MKKSDLIPATIWMVLGLSVMIVSYRMALGTLYSPGPGLMPFLLGFILILVSVPIFVQSLIRNLRRAERAVVEKGIWTGIEAKNILLILISLIAYALLLEKVGFFIIASLFLFVLFKTFDAKKWYSTLAISLVTVTLIYVLFVMVLGVELPPGLMGIG